MATATSSNDPFFMVKDEVQKSIIHLEQLYESWQKLEAARRQNRQYNSEQMRWIAEEIRSSCKTVEWDIQDLEETVRIVEANPQKFKLDVGEVSRRKQFVTEAKGKMEKILKIVNEGMKGEQQKKQRDELMDNPLMSNSNASGARNRASEEAGNDLIETEQRQQMMIMQNQDQQMDQVYSTVVNLKNIAATMGTELDDQQQLLEGLDSKVDTSGNKLQNAMNRIGKIIQSDKGDSRMTCCIIILGIIVLVLFIFLFI